MSSNLAVFLLCRVKCSFMVLSHWPHVAEQVPQQVAELVAELVSSVKAPLRALSELSFHVMFLTVSICTFQHTQSIFLSRLRFGFGLSLHAYTNYYDLLI